MGVNLKKVAKAAKEYRHILIVMRHAKAESLGKSSDRDRNLTDKGLKQAKTVAKGLAELKLVPDRIACSGAARALQTCERMLKTFGDHPTVDYRQSLYDNGVQAVFHGSSISSMMRSKECSGNVAATESKSPVSRSHHRGRDP